MSKSKGFTIIELLIATTVFSVILLIMTSGLIYIGKVYYRTVAQTKTQEASRSAIDQISQAIQFSGGSVIVGVDALCVGDTMFAKYPDLIVDGGPNKGLLRGSFTGDCNRANLQAGAVQLIPSGMFLRQFNTVFDPLLPDVYTIGIQVVSVPADEPIAAGGTSPLFDGVNCKLVAGSEFCATSKLETTIKKRL